MCVYCNDPNNKHDDEEIKKDEELISEVLSSLSKLILKAVGEDRDYTFGDYVSYGYNRAKSEIREALCKIGVEI
jgi:hypothetical protein